MKTIIYWNDGNEVEELSEPEITDHAKSAAVSNSVKKKSSLDHSLQSKHRYRSEYWGHRTDMATDIGSGLKSACPWKTIKSHTISRI